MSFANIVKSCQGTTECVDSAREFNTLDAFHNWFNSTFELNTAAPSEQFSEDDMKVLDAIEERIAEVFDDLKESFGDKGHFFTNDFYGFTKAVVMSVCLSLDEAAFDDSNDDEYDFLDE